MNNRTFQQNVARSLKIIGIVVAVLFCCFIVLLVLANTVFYTPPTHSAQETSTPTVTVPTEQPTVAPAATPKPTVDIATLPPYQLAAIDGANYSDPSVIAAYQRVLDSLHDKTGSSETDIANMTYTAQSILTKDNYTGTDNTMIDLMNAADSAITKSEHISYADVIGALITLMENPS